ncbi:MAG TPA: lysylphosphatidylglycerol synthase transmembrane domain-containing protein [Flavipsychrobacter sp.]|nr:lysylphosphatidylglycerol synthase transmembrane domain-containing protein [Flavipsychrobacter sp.]
MNKSTKIWLNYLVGGIISILLLWGIYAQVMKQLHRVDKTAWWHTGPSIYIWLCVLLMPINLSIEARKWQLLVKSAQPISYKQAFLSYLAGIAISIVTPNRIGEYPGRILYLKRKNTFRLINVSILGAMSQLLSLFVLGVFGLTYYNIAFPGLMEKIVLICAAAITLFLILIYWRFETWLPLLNKFKWLRRFNIYGQLLKRFSTKEQLTILGLSLLRLGVFTAQYLFFLRWMNIDMPLAQGYLMCALFFWVMSIVPSIALAEIGERGQVGLYLFHHFSTNTVGILGATIGLWALNLIIPAIIGSILLVRMRVLR